ncbi:MULTISPECIES: TetR/AcrR family transcriptional regulator [Halobacteriovorax]|uniref:TetR/AcrR family transcriptional regulator n=1 Tax=Halobacteriovorax vibrionivorans TaxID=2152716 RepID=A0ABY0IDK1_9BACT|nr:MULTISPECIES: TetR/AcrR family transcriptional regulator [Halobacteriovorax]RZF20697.1 TetR/AcrR family transcriptional regulator [Halobacteriovorax vibrionivorans]TGD48894.1 TetR/AcrR family transcriptional regulator [Halobacteriovorax sp. Y22]
MTIMTDSTNLQTNDEGDNKPLRTVKPKKNEEVHFRILNAVTKLEVAKGHLNWKIAEVAKEADVTRSLIYYYLGKEKDVILKEAVKYMISTVFNLTQEHSVGIRERIKIVRDQIIQMPYLLALYMINKGAGNDLSDIIAEAEVELFEILSKKHPNLDHREHLRIYFMQLGICLYRDVDDDTLDYLFSQYDRK